MIFLGLGERKRFAHKPAQPLAQRVVPALDMRSLSRVLADASVTLAKHLRVSLPKVTHRLRMGICRWDVFLNFFTSLCAAPAYGIGHHLACAPTQTNPQPRLAGFLLHE